MQGERMVLGSGKGTTMKGIEQSGPKNMQSLGKAESYPSEEVTLTQLRVRGVIVKEDGGRRYSLLRTHASKMGDTIRMYANKSCGNSVMTVSGNERNSLGGKRKKGKTGGTIKKNKNKGGEKDRGEKWSMRSTSLFRKRPQYETGVCTSRRRIEKTVPNKSESPMDF